MDGESLRVDCDRPVYRGPRRYVESGVKVGIQSSATGDTGEQGLRLPVGLGYMTADRAGTRGVPGIHKDYRNTSASSLVLDELPELSEGPLAESLPGGPVNRFPAAEPLEVLKGNSPAGAFSRPDYLLRYDMVGDPLEPRFPSRELLQMSLGRLRPSLLESPLERGHPLPDGINGLTGEGPAIGCGSQIDDAEVHADRSLGLEGSRFRYLYGKAEEETPLPVQKVRLSSHSCRIDAETRPGDKGDAHPSFQSEDTDLIGPSEGQNPLIVDDSGVFPEDVEGLPLRFIGFDNLSDCPDCELGRKPIVLPDTSVAAMMQGVTGEVSFTPCYSGDEVAGLVEGLHRFEEGNLLIGGDQELRFHREYHASF